MGYVQGASRSLFRRDSSDNYQPVVCLTETSYSSVVEMIDRVTVCSEGQTESSANDVNRSVSFSGIVVDVTSLGDVAPTVSEAIDALYAAQEASLANKKPDAWLLKTKTGESTFDNVYFYAYLSDASDSFPAEGDATFSGTLTINGKPTATAPVEE